MTEREPDFDHDYAEGAQAELFVADLRRGLERGRVEDKLDRRFVETGNIYVETACRLRAGWTPSGIDSPTTSGTWVYLLRDAGVGLVFEVDTLRRLARDPRCSQASQARNGTHPTEGRLVNVSRAMARGMFT